MRKFFFFFITMTFLTSCVGNKNTVMVKTVSTCPWQMGQMNQKTIEDYQLSPNRLAESAVSISTDLILELATEHIVDSVGRHNFLQKGIKLPAGSVGMIYSFPGLSNAQLDEVGAPLVIPVTFQQKVLDENGKPFQPVTFNFGLEGGATPTLMKREDISADTYKALVAKGITVDAKGYLRNGNSYYQLMGGKPVLWSPGNSVGSYRLQLMKQTDINNLIEINVPFVNTGGYLRSGSDYLVVDQTNGNVFLIKENMKDVFLDQIKFRVCNQIQTIETPGFDEKK